MTRHQQLKKQRILIKNLLKFTGEEYSKDKCKGYAPGCPNCQHQLLVGMLEDYLDFIEWEIEERL